MKKERAKMYEEMQFDSYAYAVDVKEQAEENLENLKQWKKMAVIGTVVGLAGYLLGGMGPISAVGGILHLVAFIISIISYIKIGGFSKVLHWAGNVMVFAWCVCPLFPLDIAISIVAFVYVIGVMLQLPYFVYRHFEKQEEKNIAAAEEYLKYFRPVNENTTV